MAVSSTSWKPGRSANPKGRPRGSRDTITEAFLRDLAKDWRHHGPEALAQARLERPAEYVRVVANLLPKEAKLEIDFERRKSEAFISALEAISCRDRLEPPTIDGKLVDLMTTKEN
jgi:hypothetical protein